MTELDDFFANQTELGNLFGVSCKVIGEWLLDIGLRTINRNRKMTPSRAAFDGDFVRKADNGRNGGYYYVWHREKTLAALVKAGYKPLMPHQNADQPILMDRLVGPFEVRGDAVAGFEVFGGDGAGLSGRFSERCATTIKNLLNVAFKYDRLN